MFLRMNFVIGAGGFMRKKTDAAAQPGTEQIQFEPPKPGLDFMVRFEVNLDAPVLELGQIGNIGKDSIRIVSTGE
jgi:hypothetical protein